MNNKLTNIFFDECYKNIVNEEVQELLSNENDIIYKETLEKNLFQEYYNLIYNLSIKQLLKWFHSMFDTFYNENKDFYLRNFTTFKNFYVTNTFKKLDRLIKNSLKLRTNYLEEIINNVRLYSSEIKDFTIYNIKFNLGDNHNGNKSSCIIITNSEKIIYKPREGYNDLLFYEINELIENQLNLNNSSYRRDIYTNDTFSIYPYVENKALQTSLEANEYYYRLGMSAAILYILGVTDLHYENIIAYGKYPIFIDLETMFDISGILQNRELTDSNDIVNSILRTHLFDYSLNYNDYMTGIGGTYSKVSPVFSEILVDKDNDRIRLKYLPNSESYHNVPLLNKKYIEIISKRSFFINGFNDSYVQILVHIDKIKGIILKYSKKLKLRRIIRPTYIYANFIRKILGSIDDIDNEEGFWKILYDYSHLNKQIIDIEKKALKSNDIPIFYCAFDSKKLFSENYTIPDFILETPHKYYFSFLDTLGTLDCRKQMTYIESALDSYYNTLMLEKRLSREDQINIGIDSILHDSLIKDIPSLSQRINGGETQHQILSPISYDLYDGELGLRLLAEVLDSELMGQRDENEIFDQILTMSETLSISCYSGRFSILKFLYLKKELNNKDDLDINFVLQEIDLFLEQKTETLDFLGGSSGTISVMIDIYKNYPINELKNKINGVLKKYTSKFLSYLNETTIIGFAHGKIGVYYVIIKILNYYQDTNQVDAYLSMKKEVDKIDIEDTFIENSNETSFSWCNGISGILLGSLLVSFYKKETPNKAIIDIFLDNYNFVRQDDSICHGHAGNLLIADYILKSNLNLGYRTADFIHLKEMLLEYIESKLISNQIACGYLYPKTKNTSLFLGEYGTILAYLLVKNNKNLSLLS